MEMEIVYRIKFLLITLFLLSSTILFCSDSSYKNGTEFEKFCEELDISNEHLQKLCQTRYEEIPPSLRRNDGKVVVNKFGQVCSPYDVLMSVHASNTTSDEVEGCHYADGLEAIISGLRGDYRGCSLEEDPEPMPICGKEHLQLIRENLDQDDLDAITRNKQEEKKEFDRHQMLQDLSEATSGLLCPTICPSKLVGRSRKPLAKSGRLQDPEFDRSCEPIKVALMPVEREHQIKFDSEVSVDSALSNRFASNLYNSSTSSSSSSFVTDQADQGSLRASVMLHSLQRLTLSEPSFLERALSSRVTPQQILHGDARFSLLSSGSLQDLQRVKVQLGD